MSWKSNGTVFLSSSLLAYFNTPQIPEGPTKVAVSAGTGFVTAFGFDVSSRILAPNEEEAQKITISCIMNDVSNNRFPGKAAEANLNFFRRNKKHIAKACAAFVIPPLVAVAVHVGASKYFNTRAQGIVKAPPAISLPAAPRQMPAPVPSPL